LELAGAAKQGRIPFVRQMNVLNPASPRSACVGRARSSSAESLGSQRPGTLNSVAR
jgi:hypothetical protein